MTFKGKITEVQPTSGTNRYGEQYSGHNITVVEVDVEEGQSRSACHFYRAQQADTPRIGDVGVVTLRTDIRESNGRKFTTVDVRQWQCTEPATL